MSNLTETLLKFAHYLIITKTPPVAFSNKYISLHNHTNIKLCMEF